MFGKIFQKLKFLYLSFISLLIGMKVTIKNYFAPAVTLDYPRKKKTMTNNYRGMVDLIPEACVICYQCIKICPVAALDLAHKQVVVETKKKNEITKFTYNAELCCFCGLCDEVCPTDAIFMNKMYEVSTYNHEDILNIDLMKEDKYTHITKNYNFADEIKRNEGNTIGIIKKAPVPPAPASPAVAPTQPAATAPATPPAPKPNEDPNKSNG